MKLETTDVGQGFDTILKFSDLIVFCEVHVLLVTNDLVIDDPVGLDPVGLITCMRLYFRRSATLRR